MTSLNLPFPPSINHYWRRNPNARGMFISSRGKQYRIDVQAAVLSQVGMVRHTGRLDVRIRMVMPNRMRRDLDNFLKVVLDALTHAAVWNDDEQIDRLEIERAGVEKPGRLEVEVSDAR